jgi:NADH-quinone oxidoreductase subunit G
MPSDRASLVVDGRAVEVPGHGKLIDALDELGIHVPRFCYHPRMSAVGMCRMCLVEVKGPRGFSLQPSCFIDVADGMEVRVDSDAVRKAQHGVIEFLLANHPLDCPVCDKGGECPLQDQAFAHGSGETRFVEEKRHYAKPIPISRLIKLDRERCIQCDRCTRFADEVAGEPLIDFAGRGGGIRISTFAGVDFDSYFSGNVVQICPVGALTATPYRFKARPWDLTQAASTCRGCDLGCPVVLQASQNELTRMVGLDSEGVNHGWLCDRGRFGVDEVNDRSSRVIEPLIRGERASWQRALGAVASLAGDRVGLIAAELVSLEDAFAFGMLARDVLGTQHYDLAPAFALDPELLLANPASIADAVGARRLVLLNVDPKEELPVLHLRLRTAVRAGLELIECQSAPSSATPLAARSVLLDPRDPEAALGELVAACEGADPSEVVIVAGARDRAISPALNSWLLATLRARLPGARVLSGLSAGHNGIATGLEPPAVEGTRPVDAIMAAAMRGELATLVLVGSDPVSFGMTEGEVSRLAERCRLVVVASMRSSLTEAAEVVLPMAMAGEVQGTTVNIEWRLGVLGQQVEPAGSAQPGWVLAEAIASRLDHSLGLVTLGDVWAQMAAPGSLLADVNPSMLAGSTEGVLLPLSRTTGPTRARALDPIATPGIASVVRQGADFSVGRALEPVHARGTAIGPGARPALGAGEEVMPGRPALPATEGLWLSLLPRLFDPEPALMANRWLAPSVRDPELLLAPATAESLGIGDGDRVQLRGATDVELTVTLDKETPSHLAVVRGVDGTTVGLCGNEAWSSVRLEARHGS